MKHDALLTRRGRLTRLLINHGNALLPLFLVVITAGLICLNEYLKTIGG